MNQNATAELGGRRETVDPLDAKPLLVDAPSKELFAVGPPLNWGETENEIAEKSESGMIFIISEILKQEDANQFICNSQK